MYVCLCKAVTDGQIRQAKADGVENLKALRRCLGVPGQCGRCARHARDVLREGDGARCGSAASVAA